MTLISNIGRSHPKVRALYAAVYAILCLGAITMIYPFLLMISGSMKSAVDRKELDIIPRFLHDDVLFYQKHIEGLFNERLGALQSVYDLDTPSFDKILPPEYISMDLVEAWNEFLDSSMPPAYVHASGYMEAPISRCMPMMLRRFKKELISEYRDDMEAMNHDLGTEFVGWNAFHVLPEDYTVRRSIYRNTPFDLTTRDFKLRQDRGYTYYFNIQGFYKNRYLKTQYTRDIAEYNRTHNTTYASYDDVRLSPSEALCECVG